MSERETIFISALEASGATSGIGDDGVEIGGLVYAMDSFCEGVHFRREWLSLEQIAYKALAINVSDLYAMNATPTHALLSVAIPPNFSSHDTRIFARAISNCAREFSVRIIGGDTIVAPLLSLNYTLFGKASKKTLTRKGIKKGDLLAYTGILGDSKRGLGILMRGGRIANHSRFVRPILRRGLIRDLAPFVRAGMDISDGLFFELSRLSKINSIGFRFFKKIDQRIGTSGEEYEMLFAFSVRHLARVKNLAKKHRVRLNIFARAVHGRYAPHLHGHHA
ncbi:MAG: thiamine-phosphate kinase [Wolinella sp.]